MRDPSTYPAFIIDMDGVLWRSKAWLPGVKEFFDALRSLKKKPMLVSNNSTVTSQGVADRMAEIGVEIQPAEVLCSAAATASYLRERFEPGTGVYPIGEQAVREALSGAGFRVLESAEGAEIVVVGFDRQVNWAKLTQAALAIEHGALFVGTNPDPSFPLEKGQAPGNGAFVTAVKVTTGVEPLIIGKPEPLLFEQAAHLLGIQPDQILVIGDRLGTDILGARRAGMPSALVLTGVTTAEQAEADEIKPDWIFDDLPALTQAIRGI
jgi:4-nitrophenyl phosphatase